MFWKAKVMFTRTNRVSLLFHMFNIQHIRSIGLNRITTNHTQGISNIRNDSLAAAAAAPQQHTQLFTWYSSVWHVKQSVSHFENDWNFASEKKWQTKKWSRRDATARVCSDFIWGFDTNFSLSLLRTPINFTIFAVLFLGYLVRTQRNQLMTAVLRVYKMLEVILNLSFLLFVYNIFGEMECS